VRIVFLKFRFIRRGFIGHNLPLVLRSDNTPPQLFASLLNIERRNWSRREAIGKRNASGYDGRSNRNPDKRPSGLVLQWLPFPLSLFLHSFTYALEIL
jgi:hypothetical protein